MFMPNGPNEAENEPNFVVYHDPVMEFHVRNVGPESKNMTGYSAPGYSALV